MKLVLDEWIVREVIDTLYMARTTFLGITELDSPQEVAKKSANETAITRRISKAIDIIQQQEQPSGDFEKKVEIVDWSAFRREVARAAMLGILAGRKTHQGIQETAEYAVQYADELIKQLKRTEI